jgi:hypothetical protein
MVRMKPSHKAQEKEGVEAAGGRGGGGNGSGVYRGLTLL